MRVAGVLRALGPIDLRSVQRDPMLRWMVLMPLLFAAGVRYGEPPCAAWLAERFGVALAPYHPLIASSMASISPMLYGAVIGFLLLDQKDDRTLTALQVTPMTTADYLLYRLSVPILLSVPMTLVVLAISGVATIGLFEQLLVAVTVAPWAPLWAVFLAAFARNKVQGFALMKGAGVIGWPPLIAYFIDSDWQWAFGVSPSYWPAKLYWVLEADDPGAWWIFAVAIVYAAVLLRWMLRRFDRVVHE